jgi:hypothetical protein
MTIRAPLVLLACVAAMVLSAVPARAAGPLLGVQDDRMVGTTADPARRMILVDRLRSGAVRADLRWDLVARRRPAQPKRSRDPAYDWSRYDRLVRAARARGVPVILAVWGTPRWAADPRIPASPIYPTRATRPRRPADFADFVTAAVKRYGPRGVRYWEIWNEPNTPLFLRPQYQRAGSRWIPSAPRYYALMLSAAYRAAKAAHPAVRVAGGVTAPAGVLDPARCTAMPDCRITPVDFVTALSKPGVRPPMDAWAHHPYPLRRPTGANLARPSYVDLYNLDLLETTLDAGYLKGKPLWLTEFGFATRPSSGYKLVVREDQQAAYLADAVRRVREDPRVRFLIWYFLQDSPNWGSGLIAQDGREKPAAKTFRRLQAQRA